MLPTTYGQRSLATLPEQNTISSFEIKITASSNIESYGISELIENIAESEGYTILKIGEGCIHAVKAANDHHINPFEERCALLTVPARNCMTYFYDKFHNFMYPWRLRPPVNTHHSSSYRLIGPSNSYNLDVVQFKISRPLTATPKERSSQNQNTSPKTESPSFFITPSISTCHLVITLINGFVGRNLTILKAVCRALDLHLSPIISVNIFPLPPTILPSPSPPPVAGTKAYRINVASNAHENEVVHAKSRSTPVIYSEYTSDRHVSKTNQKKPFHSVPLTNLHEVSSGNSQHSTLLRSGVEGNENECDAINGTPAPCSTSSYPPTGEAVNMDIYEIEEGRSLLSSNENRSTLSISKELNSWLSSVGMYAIHSSFISSKAAYALSTSSERQKNYQVSPSMNENKENFLVKGKTFDDLLGSDSFLSPMDHQGMGGDDSSRPKGADRVVIGAITESFYNNFCLLTNQRLSGFDGVQGSSYNGTGHMPGGRHSGSNSTISQMTAANTAITNAASVNVTNPSTSSTTVNAGEDMMTQLVKYFATTTSGGSVNAGTSSNGTAGGKNACPYCSIEGDDNDGTHSSSDSNHDYGCYILKHSRIEMTAYNFVTQFLSNESYSLGKNLSSWISVFIKQYYDHTINPPAMKYGAQGNSHPIKAIYEQVRNASNALRSSKTSSNDNAMAVSIHKIFSAASEQCVEKYIFSKLEDLPLRMYIRRYSESDEKLLEVCDSVKRINPLALFLSLGCRKKFWLKQITSYHKVVAPPPITEQEQQNTDTASLYDPRSLYPAQPSTSTISPDTFTQTLPPPPSYKDPSTTHIINNVVSSGTSVISGVDSIPMSDIVDNDLQLLQKIPFDNKGIINMSLLSSISPLKDLPLGPPRVSSGSNYCNTRAEDYVLHKVSSACDRCIKALSDLNNETKTPSDYISIIYQAIMELRNGILAFSKGNIELQSLDDELPLLIYCIIRNGSVKHAISIANLINDSLSYDATISISGMITTCYTTAVNYIVTFNPSEAFLIQNYFSSCLP